MSRTIIDPMQVPGMDAVHARVLPGVLKIGRRAPLRVADLADASLTYQCERDASGEGCSSFPDGRLTLDGKTYRISYNGRIWSGDTLVCEAQ